MTPEKYSTDVPPELDLVEDEDREDTSEDLEAGPESELIEPEVKEAADEEVQSQRSRLTKKSDLECVARILINEAESGQQSLEEGVSNLADSRCQERTEFRGRSAEELKNEIRVFLSKLKIDSGEAQLSKDEVLKIKVSLCEPILRGYLSGETASAMISRVEVKPLQEMQQLASAGQGYEGVMYYKPGECAIIVAKEVISGEYRNENNEIVDLDVEHMLTHENSHAVVRNVFLTPMEEGGENLARQEAMQFFNEVLEQTKNADKYPLPQHIVTVIESYKNIDSRYTQLMKSDPPPAITLDQYRRRESYICANEILTDFTAYYLQSDGSLNDFVGECLNSVDAKNVYDYMARETGASVEEMAEKFKLYRDTPLEERMEKFPEFNKIFILYKKFHGLAQKYITDGNIRSGIAARNGQEDGDEMESMLFGDGYAGFERTSSAASPQSKEESVGKAGMGLLQAFAEEVGKPVNTTLAA